MGGSAAVGNHISCAMRSRSDVIQRCLVRARRKVHLIWLYVLMVKSIASLISLVEASRNGVDALELVVKARGGVGAAQEHHCF